MQPFGVFIDRRRLAIFALGVGLLVGPRAEALSLSFVGAAEMGTATITPTAGNASGFGPYAYGGGLLIDYAISKRTAFEIGFLYLPRGYSFTPKGQTAYNVTFLAGQMPLLFRYDLLPYFSVGIGGYYARMIGGASASQGNPAPLLNTDDYGGALSVAIPIRLVKGIAVVADVRYLLSLSNASQVPGTLVALRDLQALAGVRFGL